LASYPIFTCLRRSTKHLVLPQHTILPSFLLQIPPSHPLLYTKSISTPFSSVLEMNIFSSMSTTSTSHRAAPLLALLLLLPTIDALPPRQIFERQLTCAASGRSSCPSSLPSTFCCPSDQSCIPLAGGTTAVCCLEPDGCSRIQPITCDLSLQDPANLPDATVKTTFLNGELATCGKGCCPFGYTCNDESQCVRDADQSVLPKGAAPPQSSPPTSTVSPETPSQVAGGQGNTPIVEIPPPADEKGNGNGTSAGAIVGVVFGVLGAVAITAILVFCLLRRRRRAQFTSDKTSSKHRHSRSSSSFGHTISEPIPQGGSTLRSDFMLRPSPTMPSTSPRRTPGRTKSGRILPLFRRDAHAPPLPFPEVKTAREERREPLVDSAGVSPPSTPGKNSRQVAPIRSMKTRPGVGTTPLHPRELSGVSINIFADPDTVGRGGRDYRLSTGTTFTELMEKADLAAVHRGEPFLPGTSPALRNGV
jgi:hypothetical protein